MSRYILITILCLMCSCSDYFELDRPPENPWLTLTEFERAPIGAYAGLFSGDQWNMPWVNERFIKTNMGDDVGYADEPDKGHFRETKQTNNWTQNTFVSAYRTIATVNDALDFVAKNNGNPFPDATASEIENNLQRIVGELHFVRAYSYYLLQTTFGHTIIPSGDNSTLDIPMPISYAKTAQEAKNPKIGTTQEVYDLIVRDLKIARGLLPEKFDAAKHHPSYAVRANRFAASGMLVRAYMQKGAYDSALLECNYIIDQNNGAYDLTEEPIQAFNKSTIDRGKEVIFYAPYYDNNLPVPNHLSVINQTWGGAPTPWVQSFMDFNVVKRLKWMANPKSDTTLNIDAKRDKRFSQLITVRYPVTKHLPTQSCDCDKKRATMKDYTTFISNKYYRGNGVNTNVPLIRLAEIYLTRAVILIRKGLTNEAAADLNTVRSRAWNESVAGAPYTALTGAQITEEMINDERIIELFAEGDRINYLRSIKVPIPKGDRPPTLQTTTDPTDPYTSEIFIWALPVLEVNFNDGL